jgi:hypothetical protein
MKTAIATAVAFIVLTGAAFSQTLKCIQGDPSAVLIGTMTTSITFQTQSADTVPSSTDSLADSSTAPTSGGDLYGTKPKNTGDVIIDVYVWSIGGKTVYAPNLNAMTFSGSDQAIDDMSTMDLLNLIAQVSVGQGLAHNYSTCGGTSTSNQVKVAYPSCISRVGSGLNTRFESCGGDGCCIRTYAVCCPDGSNAPYIKLIGASSSATCGGTGASGGACVSTCP